MPTASETNDEKLYAWTYDLTSGRSYHIGLAAALEVSALTNSATGTVPVAQSRSMLTS